MPQYIIPTIFTAVDRLTPPVLRMQTALNSLAVIGGAKGKVLQNSLDDISTKSMAIGTNALMMGAALAIPLALGARAAISFEKQMTNVATLIDTTRESMDAMGSSVLDISRRVPIAVGDLTESLYYIRSAGIDGAHAMGVLETSSKLAVAGLSTATEAAKALTSAMVSFRQQGLTSDQIANSFFLTVKEGKTTMAALNESFGANAVLVASAGIKLQEFNGATAALTNTGMEASLAQIAVANSVLGLIRPSTEMKKVYKDLNVLTGEQLIAAQGYGGALDAVTASARKLGIEEAKLFNRTAFKGVIALTGQARDMRVTDTKEQFEGVESLTLAYQKQLGTTAAQAELAKNKLSILGITIGQGLLTPLTDLFEAFSAILSPMADFAKSHTFLTKILVYGVALFAGLALVVGAGALALSVATKGVWLWNIGIGAMNLVVGAAIALQGTYNSVLMTSRGAFLGYAAATYIMNAGLLATLGWVGLAVAAFAVFYNLVSYNNDKLAFMNNQIKLTKDGFVEMNEPIKQASIALAEYNKAMKEYNDQQVDEAYDIYMLKNHPVKAFFHNAILLKPFMGLVDNPVEAPKRSDFPDLDTTNSTNDTTNSTVVNVNIDKAGNATASNGKGGAIPVIQKQSGVFRVGNANLGYIT